MTPTPRIGNRDYAKPPTAKEVRNETARRKRANGETTHSREPWQRWELIHANRAMDYVAERHGRQWAAVVRMALFVGLRRAEVCGLRWRDVDFKARRVTIRTSRSESSYGAVEENDPKNGRGREVGLSEIGLRLLREWAEEQAVIHGTEVAPPDGYVFTSDLGLPWRPKALADVRWRTIAKELTALGLPGPVTFHGLRKISGALGLNYWGEDLYAVAQRLGHSDVKVTQDHYAYLARDRAAEYAAARDRVA